MSDLELDKVSTDILLLGYGVVMYKNDGTYARIAPKDFFLNSDYEAQLATARNEALEEVERDIVEVYVHDDNAGQQGYQRGIDHALAVVRALKTEQGE